MMRLVRTPCTLGLFVGLWFGIGCWSYAPNHCVNREGDASCVDEGGFCSLCEVNNDGCVDEIPSKECHWTGVGTTGASTGSELGMESTGSREASGEVGNGGVSDGISTSTDGDDSADTTLTAVDGSGSAADGEGGSGFSAYAKCKKGPAGLLHYCSHPYDDCYGYIDNYSMCTYTCVDDNDCPMPIWGDAMVYCVTLQLQQINICVMDCAEDSANPGGPTSCPAGMECVVHNFGNEIGEVHRCLWPDSQ